jgi:hypothetical protein
MTCGFACWVQYRGRLGRCRTSNHALLVHMHIVWMHSSVGSNASSHFHGAVSLHVSAAGLHTPIDNTKLLFTAVLIRLRLLTRREQLALHNWWNSLDLLLLLLLADWTILRVLPFSLPTHTVQLDYPSSSAACSKHPQQRQCRDPVAALSSWAGPQSLSRVNTRHSKQGCWPA